MPETAYPVADLTVETSFALERQPRVNPQELARQLKDISDAIAPVLAQADTKAPFGLQSIELSLTIGAEGGIWFVAKGSAEASITATFSRPTA